MANTIIAKWEGREYEHNPRSSDWYWVLGIVAVTGAVVAILFNSFLIAILILVAAITIALHATKKPTLHQFCLVDKGIMIGDDLHPFERMISFSVIEDIAGELPPILSVKNTSWHSPHLEIPLEGVNADKVYAYFLQNVDEDEHKPTFADIVAVWLGF